VPDVERFDLEPRRPLLHGSIPEVTTESLSGLTTEQKIPLVLDIIGADTMSARLRASLIEIAPSLKANAAAVCRVASSTTIRCGLRVQAESTG
jgi:hypothetical protein